MTHSALARYRRFQAKEPVLRLITFQLRHNHFCLPLALARRVISPTTETSTAKLGLTRLHQENVPLVDVANLVYQSAPALAAPDQPPAQLTAAATPDPSPKQMILVIDSPRAGLLGLWVDGTPTLKRAKKSAFSPVPSMYLIMNHMQGINTLVTLGETEPPLFLLDVDALLPE